MNFVKIHIVSAHCNTKLFIKEADCFKALQQIQAAHCKADIIKTLSVSMRRVVIEDAKARPRKNWYWWPGNKIKELCDNSMAAINNLLNDYISRAA